jgi:hypothetical protein
MALEVGRRHVRRHASQNLRPGAPTRRGREQQLGFLDGPLHEALGVPHHLFRVPPRQRQATGDRDHFRVREVRVLPDDEHECFGVRQELVQEPVLRLVAAPSPFGRAVGVHGREPPPVLSRQAGSTALASLGHAHPSSRTERERVDFTSLSATVVMKGTSMRSLRRSQASRNSCWFGPPTNVTKLPLKYAPPSFLNAA